MMIAILRDKEVNILKNQINIEEKYGPKRKGMLVIYASLLIFLLVLTVTATYTWFSLSRTPQVSNLSMYVTTHTGLEIALTPDSEEWGSKLSYVDMASENFPLRPITWSDENQSFYTAGYGFDGRLNGNWHKLTDELNANHTDRDGYYSLGVLYARTNEDVTVSLTPSVTMEEGISGSGTYLIGAPLWDAEAVAHKNAGEGAENAVRVGIQVTDLDENNNPIEQTKRFFIYEPNCDTHADGSQGYVATPSIDGGETLVPQDRLILQGVSSWEEADPVQNGVQVYSVGDFQSETELFSLKAHQKVMIKLYLWLEGQDVDCTNEIDEAQIIANIQFKADAEINSGLVPIN
jgi:flagellar basal body-associated protein FliL